MASDNTRAWRIENPWWLIAVPRELLTVYHRVIGNEAVLLWLHLQCFGENNLMSDIDALVAELHARTGFSPETVMLALHQLEQYELVEMKDRVIKVCPPLTAEEFAVRFADELAVGLADEQSISEGPVQETLEAAEERDSVPADDAFSETLDLDLSDAAGPAAEESGASEEQAILDKEVFSSPEADFQAVLDLYHKRIGMMGPKQRDKLRFWVEESGMSAEVVAAAIDITARKAENPRIQYLEGVLRNWYNDGVRTFEEALKKYPEIAGESSSASASYEGAPNAGAYTEADQELIQKWKELYPDEYSS
ncbi:MAG: DnaD domain protein [Firmicutes bacterium]|nr:DnaD domain protein [Bacillota bacterium]